MAPNRWQSLLLAASISRVALGGVHEKWSEVPHGWQPLGLPADNKTVTTFTIALHQKFDQLESLLLDISTPGSKNYGKHWTKAEVDQAFHPGDDVVSNVAAWLQGYGVQHYNVDGAFIDFAADLETANELLSASYQYYHKDGTTKLRTLQYSIPDGLQGSIALITPGTYFGQNKNQRAARRSELFTARKSPRTTAAFRRAVNASCSDSLTPACLKQMYNVGDYKADPNSGSKVAFGSFLNQSASLADLFQFEDLNQIPRQNITLVSIANGSLEQDPSLARIGEANLDVQNIVGMAPGLPVTEFSTGGSPPFIPTLDQPTAADNNNEPYVPYFRYLLSLEDADLPQVNSISYGDQEDSVPLNYAQLACNLSGLLGLRGITVVCSSGDGGVGGTCLAPDFKTVEFEASFPATCPYITAVGGTVAVEPEIAWNQSSGGFSEYFPRPSWQNQAIDSYVKGQVSSDTLAYYGKFTNFTGRGFPDVSLHSLDPLYEGVYRGVVDGNGGTSASAPLWAGIVGLLNDARLRAGKPVLGWMNPLIYWLANQQGALVDVTAGYSYGCRGRLNGSALVAGARWNATAGWDPVTGFGIPDFQKLKDVVLAL